MGMDLVGINPKKEIGNHFSRSYRTWIMMLDYLFKLVTDIVSFLQFDKNFNFKFIEEEECNKLVLMILEEYEPGNLFEYVGKIKKRKPKRVICKYCEGTGRRKEPPDIGAGKVFCNVCRGSGRVKLKDLPNPLTELEKKMSFFNMKFSFIGDVPELFVESIMGFLPFGENCGGF